MIRTFTSFLAALLAAMLLCAAAVAQTNRGGISGTVTDATGAVIPGASVTITNVGTNQQQKLTTSAEGAFAATSLDPVVYSVTVEAQGFKKTVVNNIKVDTAATATVNLALEAGAVETVIDVTAETPLLNTASGTTMQTITERQIQDVPLNNRSVLDLAVTAPNVAGDAGSEDPAVTSGQPVPGFNLSLNGGRPGSTAILADGVNNTGVGIARTVVSFTPETVQEFTVQTSAYSAEFGNTAGGVINVTTKSGTNDYNGTALWYHRNPVTNAGPFATGRGPRTPVSLRYNQFSLSGGGPMWLPKKVFGPLGYDGHNRTFFFAAYEPRYRQDFLTVTTLLPTAAERAGDFRNLVRTSSGYLPADVAAKFGAASTGNANIYQQFTLVNGKLQPIVLTGTNQFCQFGDPRAIQTATGPQCTPTVNATPNPALNVLPSNYIDPTALKVLQYMSAGGDYFVDDAGLVRNYIINRFVRQDETRYTLRLDHTITESNKVNFRYTATPTVGIRGFGSDINGNTAAYGNAKQFLLADNHVFTSTLSNDLRLNYTRGVFSEDFSPEFSIKGGRNLATELGLPSLTAGGLPLFQISGDGTYNAFADIGSSGSTNNYNLEQRYNLNDIVYWTRGNQTWKFGVDLSNATLNVIPFFAASGGRWQFRQIQTSNNRASNVANGGDSLASLLLGVPNVVDVRPLLLDYTYQWKSGAAFVQNDWKVRPNLTLNLGLRYSLQLPRTEKNDLQGVFRPDLAQTVTLTDAQRRAIATGIGVATTAPIPSNVPTSAKIPAFAFAGRGGRSRYIVDPDYLGFEPRFGFAWSPRFLPYLTSHNAVVRGGYGISHAPLTGNNRLPNPDFGSFTQASTTATGSNGTADATQPLRLTGNAPQVQGVPLAQALGVPDNGLLYANSIAIPGYAVAPGGGSSAVPYSQNWNLSISFEPFRNTVIETAYVGNRGVHLFLPLVNINPRDSGFVESLEAQGFNADTAFNDPLGRKNLLGATITVPRGSVLSQYLGFNTLNNFFDPSANSIRHAAYIDVRRRVGQGLTFTANYTFGKSIDDASDASPDTRVITEVGQTQGQVSFGAARRGDRAISTFDIKHNFSSTFVYDLPFGHSRRLLASAPGAVDAALGGWTMAGVFRLVGGTPFLPYLTDSNRLGGSNRTVRPDLVPGVPIKNPLWRRDCPFGISSDNVTPCEPYINPAAFRRPAKGSLGNAPRTLDVRAPAQQYFDFSVQKSFRLPFLGKDERRRFQFRVDLINAFNHPAFRLSNSSGTSGFTGLGGAVPAETDVTQAELTAWLAANPGRTATLAGVNQLLTNSRVNGALPLNFFSVNLPQGFGTRTANSFDITTLEGLKLYRLRQNYDTGFGTLRAVPNPRYIQFGLKLYF